MMYPARNERAREVAEAASARIAKRYAAAALSERRPRATGIGAREPDFRHLGDLPLDQRAQVLGELSRTVGNARVSRMLTGRASLMRQHTSAPERSGRRRVIMIDLNVLDQINRGNERAAKRLRELAASADVYVSRQVYNEAVRDPAIPRTATAQRLMLEELGIEIAPAGSLAGRFHVYSKNLTASGGGTLGPKDMMTAANARAIGAEIWSFDTAFRGIEKTLDVRVAPESYDIPNVEGQKDYRIGRRLLGLPPVDISLLGAVRRPPKATPPSSSGGSPAGPPGGSPTADGSAGALAGSKAAPPARAGSIWQRMRMPPPRLQLPAASLKMLLKGLTPKARPGAGSLAGAIGATILQQQKLEDDFKKAHEAAAEQFAGMLESALDFVFRHPDETVYVNVVLRSVDPLWLGPFDVELVPYIDSSKVHVFFDVEPRSGVLRRGRTIDSIYIHNVWEDTGTSVDLDTVLQQASPQIRVVFARARQSGREESYRRSPQSRPLSHVTSTPREDAVRRE